MKEAAKLGLVVGGSAALGTGIWWFFFRKAPVVAPPAKSVTPSAPAPVIEPKKTKLIEPPVAPTVAAPSQVTIKDRWDGAWAITFWKTTGDRYDWQAMFLGNRLNNRYTKAPLISGSATGIALVPETAAAAVDNWCGLVTTSASLHADDAKAVAALKSEYGVSAPQTERA